MEWWIWFVILTFSRVNGVFHLILMADHSDRLCYKIWKKLGNASPSSRHFVVWMLIFLYCSRTTLGTQIRNRFECVSSVQKQKWKIKTLTNNNNNNNNNNMTKAVYYQLVQCRRLSLSSFRIVAIVFFLLHFLPFFIRPMEIWKRKWMQSRQHWIVSRTWILM